MKYLFYITISLLSISLLQTNPNPKGVDAPGGDKYAFAKSHQAASFESKYFIDVSETHSPQMATQGNTMDAKPVDVDGDGDLDIIGAGEFSYNLLLINDGNGKFTNESLERLSRQRHDSEDIAAEDFDKDGDIDIVFVSEDDFVNEYYTNDGKGFFTDRSAWLPVEGKSNAVLSIDLDEDGFMDLLIGNEGVNFCLLNDGDGGWQEAADRIPSSVKTTQDLEAGDIDGDGDLDIICGNENDNEIWINNGKGYFKNETEERIKIEAGAWETREVDLGDIDGDGDLDMFLANVNFLQTKDQQNRLFLNDGKGHFRDVTTSHLPAEKMHTVDGDFVDWDSDGDQDLINSNAFGHSYQFYQNDGKGKFSNVTKEVLPASVTGDGIDIEAADYNGDGKIDLYLCNFRGSDMLLFGK